MRIVLDSNVLVRAIISPTGPAAALRQMIRPPDHLLVTSKELLDDVQDSLNYPRLQRIHGLDDVGIDQAVRDLYARSLCIGIPAHPLIPKVSRDRDDDLVIATAVHGRADVLCTRDNDILDPPVVRYCASHGINVLTDVGLLARLRQSPGTQLP
jgi:putative PIN family toxin of toxin-antitoxin system